MNCRCENCGYWYKGDTDDFPCCHAEEWLAPCNYDEDEDDDYEEDEDFKEERSK